MTRDASRTRWPVYVLSIGLAVYWASNLVLWFPWSYNATLGMTLMLTVSPILWGYATFLCLRTYPGPQPMRGALTIALILVVMAVIMDLVFFGLIRDAMQQLLHPTTFYAYAFLLCLPFLVARMFEKRIERARRSVTRADFVAAGTCAALCVTLLSLIIISGTEA